MTAEQLRSNRSIASEIRNSILQEAISGRLVSQDPNDEPASVLLQRIREEKAQLVKEGKLKKKDLVETPIKEEEIPFDIPASWEWARLNSICDKIVDGDHNPPQGLSEPTEYLMISSRNINNNKLVNLDCVRYLSKEVFDIENLRTTLTEGDILFTSVGSLGRSCVYLGGRNLCFQRSVSIIHTLVYNYWLKYFFDSNYYQSFVIEKSTGTAQVGFYLNQLSKSLIAVPPLAEQKRIVAKLEELLPIVEQYGKAQKELDELNAALPARLRQSILQEAISGNLTEHDLSDKWADEYCTKLPKLKYKSSPEWPQDYPFEIPENWRWCRIGDICELLNGYAFKSNQYKDKGVRVIRITNVQDGYIVDNSSKFYPSIPDIEKYTLKEGDLLMSLTGNVGRVGILPQSMLPAALNQRVACLRLKDERLKPFLFWYLRCPIFRERCEDSGHGMAQLNISTEWVKQEYIPLPPLAEQQRIVAKIEELFAEIDKLK